MVVLDNGWSIEQFMGLPPKLMQNGWKVGSALWLCVCCNVLAKRADTSSGLAGTVRRVLFEVPAETLSAINEQRMHALAAGIDLKNTPVSRYYEQLVGEGSSYACYDNNPKPLDRPW